MEKYDSVERIYCVSPASSYVNPVMLICKIFLMKKSAKFKILDMVSAVRSWVE
jgi:hypothetical protein